MSAQAGIWNFDGRPIDPSFLDRMADAIAGCGPDGGDRYMSGFVGMVYRAFHTTKESRLESQPYVSRYGFVLTWDGRLDNRDELIPMLGKDLVTEASDLKIVTAALGQWGTDCFRRFAGDWALSVWDPRDRTLTLARDYVGVRHLYYYLEKASVTWCTLLVPLLLTGQKLTMNDEYIAGYLAFWPEARLTPYREIHAVPPGKFVSIRDGKISVDSYWGFDPNRRIHYKTDQEYETHFRHLFRKAVSRRLRSDSPILAELSGGLDSSSIVCMADEIMCTGNAETPRLDTLSFYDPKEPEGDDWIYFTKIEERRGRIGHHINLENLNTNLPLNFNFLLPIPGTLSNAQAEAERFKIFRNGGYRVVLSGIGGDEFLGGIPDPRSQLADLIVQFRFVKLARQLIAWSLTKRQPWIQLLSKALCELLPQRLLTRIEGQRNIEPWIDDAFALRHRIALHRLGPLASFGFFLPSRRNMARTVEAISWQMAKRQPTGPVCEETRYPFLDRDLIEFLISIPSEQLLRPGERRSLMRRSFANLLPIEVLTRQTKGTSARFISIALNNTWADLRNILESPVSSRFGYLNRERFLKDLIATKHGNGQHAVRLMRAISLELWLRNLCTHGLIPLHDKTSPSEIANRVPLQGTQEKNLWREMQSSLEE